MEDNSHYIDILNLIEYVGYEYNYEHRISLIYIQSCRVYLKKDYDYTIVENNNMLIFTKHDNKKDKIYSETYIKNNDYEAIKAYLYHNFPIETRKLKIETLLDDL